MLTRLQEIKEQRALDAELASRQRVEVLGVSVTARPIRRCRPLPRHRPRWRPPRFDAQRAPRQARRATLPAAARRCGRHQAAARHHRCPSALPPRDPLDPGEEGGAPMQSILEQPDRAKPPSRQAAVLPDAGLREFRVCRPVLYCLRRAAPVLPRSPPRSRMGAACCAATALRSARYAASQPLVPLGLYEEKIPAPQGWRGAPCGYLAFRDSAERFHQEAVRSARSRGGRCGG